MEKFHDLVEHYERLHDEHEYKPHTVDMGMFYKNFLHRMDETLGEIHSESIIAIIERIKIKAEYLSDFHERRRLHDLAEKMVDRLNEIGMELYGLPDLEFVLESTMDIEVDLLVSCCPEFSCHEHDDDRVISCEGTIQHIRVKPHQDLQAAVKLYYEKYCRNCRNRTTIEKELN
ncbi:MAG: hypothetical protein ACTSU9_15755 [Promethearchaeota archaeon]